MATYLNLEELGVRFVFRRQTILAICKELCLVLHAALEGLEDVRLNVVRVEL